MPDLRLPSQPQSVTARLTSTDLGLHCLVTGAHVATCEQLAQSSHAAAPRPGGEGKMLLKWWVRPRVRAFLVSLHVMVSSAFRSAATEGLMSLRSSRRAVRYSAMCAAIPRSAPGQRLSPANRHAHSSLPRTRPIEFRVSVRLSVSTERRTADQSTE